LLIRQALACLAACSTSQLLIDPGLLERIVIASPSVTHLQHHGVPITLALAVVAAIRADSTIYWLAKISWNEGQPAVKKAAAIQS